MVIFSVFNGAVAEGLAEPILTLTFHERNCLAALYWHDSMGLLSGQLATLNIDYYLEILPKHIKEIENDLTVKRSGWTSIEMFLGSYFALAAATLAKFAIMPEFHTFMAGKFRSVEMPNSMMKDLASVDFTDAEKRKLQLIDVKTIYLSYAYYYATYSREELEKINLLARQWANKQAKVGLVIFSIWPAILAAFAGSWFYEAIHHVENTNKRLNESLERDNRLLDYLKNAKQSRLQ